MRKVLLVIVFMLCSIAGFAQYNIGTFWFKPKVGLSIANVTNSDATGPRYGIVAGGEFEYQDTESISFSIGALYSMQGAVSIINQG